MIIFDEIEELLIRTLNYLDKLTPDNFDANFSEAVKCMKSAKDLRNENSEIFEKFNFEKKVNKIDFITKQISEVYDNIVERYHNEISELEISLKNSLNKKKILRYQRG